MTLKNRLTLVLTALAVVPLLLVGWLGYRQALRGVEATAERQLKAEASELAQEIARARTELHEALEELAASPEAVEALEAYPRTARADDGPGEPAEARLSLEAAPRLERFLSGGGRIELRHPSGRAVYSRAASTGPTRATAGCTDVPGSDVRISVPVRREGVAVGDLAYRGPFASEIVRATDCRRRSSRSRSLLLLDREARTSLYGPDDGPDVAALGLDGDDGRTSDPVSGSLRNGGDDLVLAYANVTGTPWTVVATAGLRGLEAPIRDSWSTFALFVLLLAAGAATVAKLVVGRMLAPLQEVSVAAERIGKGELAPWLPPPGDDEIGRLTLSVNRMADRIERRIRQVEHASRMDVVQDLATYLCDRMRDPLSSIRLSLQAVERATENGAPDADDAGDTREAVRTSLAEISRLDGLVSSVARLGSTRPPVVRPCSIRRAIHEAVSVLESDLLRDRIRFRAYLHEGPDTVPADAGQLKNVFLQIFLNGIQAVSPGGVIEIRTGIAEVEEGKVVVARIRDDGCGIDPARRERIFEPFFTTRENAAGLGLAIALRSIRTFGGDLELVEGTSPRGGAEFSLILPLIESASTEKPFRRPPAADGIFAADAWKVKS